MPHIGLELPADQAARLNETGRARTDADWRVERLFDGLAPGASRLQARYHRYWIDLNRDPSGASLYPGRATTELCPTTTFDGNPIWRPGEEPTAAEIDARRAAVHAPYHDALAAEIARHRARRGVAILVECHSIRSHVPRLFEGELPVLNIGTVDGASCAPEIEAAAVEAARASGLSWVLNGRFKGGWTTRAHGRPADGAHAIQLEIAQRAYLAAEAPPWAYDDAVACPLRAALATMLQAFEAAAATLAGAARR